MIRTSLDAATDITTFDCSRDVTLSEIQSALTEFFDRSPTPRILLDLRNAHLVRPPISEIRSLLATAQGLVKSLGLRLRAAVIASTDFEYGMARMFEALSVAEGSSYLFRVFEMTQTAKRWLLSDE